MVKLLFIVCSYFLIIMDDYNDDGKAINDIPEQK